MKLSKRVTELPPYLFAEIEKAGDRARAKGLDIVSLGIADPDLPPPEWLYEILAEEIRRPGFHNYPDYRGLSEFHSAVSQWMEDRFGIAGVDAEREVISLIGGKEGVAHLLWALCDPGDVALLPDPAYPVYSTNAIYAGAEVHLLPLRRENGFLIDLAKIPEEVARRATVIFINYPNNPTGVCASKDFLHEVVRFSRKYDIAVVSDNPYSEIYYTDDKPLSILQIDGAKEICIEVNSFSKFLNITGWRVGWAAGNEALVNALLTVKSNLDSGVFNAVQMAMARALTHPEREEWTKENLRRFKGRRDFVASKLDEMGIWHPKPSATYYFWCKIPKGFVSSAEFARDLLSETGVVVSPGRAFGPSGEGYFRISITACEEDIAKGMERLKAFIADNSAV